MIKECIGGEEMSVDSPLLSTFLWQDIGDPSYLGISFIEDLNNTQFANIQYFNTVFSIPPLLFIELLSPKMSSFGNRAIIILLE